MKLIDAQCRVDQAEAVLSAWMELLSEDNRENRLVGAVMALLDGVAEAISAAGEKARKEGVTL